MSDKIQISIIFMPFISMRKFCVVLLPEVTDEPVLITLCTIGPTEMTQQFVGGKSMNDVIHRTFCMEKTITVLTHPIVALDVNKGILLCASTIKIFSCM